MAHAIVRSITMHAQRWHEAKKDFQERKESDPEATKVKTKQAQELWKKMQLVDRHQVMNRRTGWVATQDWLSRHMVVDQAGVPRNRNPKSKAKAWVVTVRIKMTGTELEAQFRPSLEQAFRRIRCWDIRSGEPRCKLMSLAAGYQHVFEDFPEEARSMLGRPPTQTSKSVLQTAGSFCAPFLPCC